MNEQVQQFLITLQALLNEGKDGAEFNFNFVFPGGKVCIAAKKELDPLPDNVIQFPR